MNELPPKASLLAQVKDHRNSWGPRPSDVTPDPVGEGEESVWDYPRPPEIRPAMGVARVIFGGREIARSENALRVVETAGAPVYYFPPADVDESVLTQKEMFSVCEWKGAARHFDVANEAARAENAAFAYPDPFDDVVEGMARIAGWYGFYPGKMEACYVGDEKVRPQPGAVYAGWVTRAIKGPIKGGPGTSHW